MRVVKEEHGIVLIPENAFERDCLAHVVNKSVTLKWTDEWDQKGDVRVSFPVDPWEKHR